MYKGRIRPNELIPISNFQAELPSAPPWAFSRALAAAVSSLGGSLRVVEPPSAPRSPPLPLLLLLLTLPSYGTPPLARVRVRVRVRESQGRGTRRLWCFFPPFFCAFLHWRGSVCGRFFNSGSATWAATFRLRGGSVQGHAGYFRVSIIHRLID